MDKILNNTVHFLTIDNDYAGQRIDNFLITKLKGVPKTRIYRLLRKGEVRVNKKRIGPDYRLVAKDIVRIPPVRLPTQKEKSTPSESLIEFLKTRILFEDKYLIIINKPPNIPVHGGTGVSMGLIEALRHLYPRIPLELAHRLDLETSGCLIVAKKRSTLKEVNDLLREGKVSKIYWALTKGHWTQKETKVDVPLLKNHLSSGERIVKVSSEGKEALSFFSTVKTFERCSLMEVDLKTGRTHQIRVHAQYRRHPIAGDSKYGDKQFTADMKKLGLKRLFLHAKRLSFTLPSSGVKYEVEAPLDSDLEQVVKRLPARG